MRFRRKNVNVAMKTVSVLALLCAMASGPAFAEMDTAVVPLSIIYPGEVISQNRVEEVEVTNPNLTGDYAKKIRQVSGMVSKRTLLPGRTISLSGLRQPFAITRGSNVRIVFNVGGMSISASGMPLDDAAVGDVIKVRNSDSGVTVSGTVMADGTVQVLER
jgi:flagella basal body P-ring formation protein FlgA